MKAQVSQAIKRARRFHGKAPRRVSSLRVPAFEALVLLGDAKAVEYGSDKTVPRLGGKKYRIYRHKIGASVKVYTDSTGKWLLIGGGNFHVTDWMRG